VHRAAVLSGPQLRLEDLLPRRTLVYAARHPPATGAAEPCINLVDATLRDLLHDAYRRYGSVRRAAAALGLPKSTFADRARKLGIL
jgi:transcriptional regulator of acetoin/glycerol metabolism